MVKETQIIRYGDDVCILFSDELCRKYNIKVGDDVDVSYNKEKDGIVITPLK